MKNTILISLFICVKLLQPITAQAEFLDLATMPLQTSGSSDVKPNLMFILDNSGSMGFDYTPDWADSSSLWLFENASYNTQYYNPAVTYTPAMTAQNVSMGNQTNFPAVKRDVTASGAAKGGTVNLTSSADYFAFVPGEYCTTASLTSCIRSTQETSTNSFPSDIRWCNSEAAAKAATLTGSQSCQGIRSGNFTWLRQPRASYRLRITVVSGTVSITSIKVNNIELLSGTVSDNSSNDLADKVGTRAGSSVNGICETNRFRNCQVSGNEILSVSGNEVKFRTVAGDAVNTTNPVQVSYTGGNANITVEKITVTNQDIPGSLVYVKIANTVDSYTLPGKSVKGSERTDCIASVCTYVEEMTNFSNWYTYYRTRMQAMKTATSQAFNALDSRYRVGFMTINEPSDNYLNIAPFDSTQKENWYIKLFAVTANGGTPLRNALSIAGRHFAGKATDIGSQDPIQYACQQNFTLLTTDGYWNGAAGVDINARSVGNLDGGGTPRPQFDSANAAGSLADVAKYYYDTDIRDGGFSNCSGALGSSVCGTADDYPKQNMVTLTLGLGIDGTLVYTEDYKTQAIGDFRDIRTGAKNWPNPIPTENGTRIDDLWHAAVNAGGTYYSAKNPKLLRESLAKGLSEIKSVQGASAAAAASSLAPTNGDNYQYVASYQTVKWIGNLEARTVNVGTLETSESAVWCVESVASASCAAPAVEARSTSNGSTSIYCKTPNSDQSKCDTAGGILGTVLGTNETASCYVEISGSCTGRLQNQVATNSRKIYFNANNALAIFSADNLLAQHRDALSGGYFRLSQMQGLLASNPKMTDPAKVNKLVDYLRGRKTYEDTATNPTAENRLFRERQATLGDVSQSRPAFFKVSNAGYLDSNYKKYKADMAGRTPAVYVGANDGMLHAFNANTGDELWAFIPTPAFANLANLADKEYGANYHTNYVNGNPVVADVCVSGCSGSNAVWHTILVSGLNGGGRGYFAIDVTSPENPVLLWEFGTKSSETSRHLGYTFGNPVVTKMKDGRWVVLVTSGYNNGTYARKLNNGTPVDNSPTGDGAGWLYVLDANTGALVRNISTGEGTPAEPSGLAKISAYAEQMFENNSAINVYGGDLNGNIWRFDINTGAVTKVAMLKGSDGSVQKVTTQPELGKVDKNMVVIVGTGKFLESADLTNSPLNSVYTIKDNGQSTAIQGRTLIPQTLSSDRKISSSANINFDNSYGWFLDFPAGERVNLDPLLLNGVLLMPTLVPTSQACSGAGYGWFNYFDYKTGRSILPSGIVSERMTSPAVGYNIVYDSKNVPHVVVTGSNDPTPQQLSLDDQVFGISGVGKTGNIFKQKSNGSYGTKQSWRELIQ